MTALRRLDWPKIDVEVQTTDADLAVMIERTGKGFSILGEVEPYWSVLTADRFRSENITDAGREFYQTGVDNIAGVFRSLDRVGIKTSGTAFELGCGVGRLTFPLARAFTQVIAADISASHLRSARIAAEECGINNVQWIHAANLHAIHAIPEIDFFFSMIVLQHNPPPIIYALIRKILSKLAPGGGAYFQVPTYIEGYKFRAAEYLKTTAQPIEMHCLPQPDLFRAIEISGCQILECREDSCAGEGPGILSNTVMVRRRS